ncbi:DegT/DnrJ/EryC1/StrS family aminotransferase [Pseudotabrizicola algicola]|uniref:DegT/DnrJ/EryC1/StrS family aminotransferase n=1 Tax=Pseudotabrizicola algicola TaxID=2709381 RepID=A0A6B3RK53_9RHOB|nr:DegT/DnrJ/EryC1/StrS family aminotransferase [Pseudotabrizicola algicola]NEX44815.1 DegT/DnrJ/EryC1/StrS family aminotransferase [Pseudotabrizicola algicola]
MTTIPEPATLRFGQPVMPDEAELLRLMAEVLRSGRLTNGGPLHARLEAELELQIGGPLRLTSSGTMAVMLALRLGGLPAGGEVITSPLSFAASVQAIDWCGLRPVFADVEPEFGTLCPKAVERAISPQTVAILGVHFQGIACDVDALERIARAHGLWLVFDAAQAPDLTWQGKSLCLAGDASAMSLHATKLLTTAEGGAVVVRSQDHAERLARMRNFGLEGGRPTGPGINGKLSEVHAAFGLAVLPRLKAELRARAEVRRWYDEALSGLPVKVLAPRPDSSESHIYYTLQVPPVRRASMIAALEREGIMPRVPFDLLCGPGTTHDGAPIHSGSGAVVVADVAGSFLSLPLHGDMQPSDMARAATALGRALE